MKQNYYKTTLEWLTTHPSLDRLCSRHPQEWAAVPQDISAIIERGVAEELKAYLFRLLTPAAVTGNSPVNRQKNTESALSQFILSRWRTSTSKCRAYPRWSLNRVSKKASCDSIRLMVILPRTAVFQVDGTQTGFLVLVNMLWPLVWQEKANYAIGTTQSEAATNLHSAIRKATNSNPFLALKKTRI